MVTLKSLAFVFPGQGSQVIGMLKENQSHPVIAKTLDQANQALGYDLKQIMFEGPKEKLAQTEITQPALLTCSIALWRAWINENTLHPALLAGHSLGEYSALVAADVLDFQEAVKLVALRGQYMQEAVTQGSGSMAAILGMEDHDVEKLCEDCAEDDVLSAVNYNAPGQVVVAGNSDAVKRACLEAKNRGASRAIPLPVSVPSHCALMEPAAQKLALYMQNIPFKSPTIPVIHNVDVKTHDDPGTIKDILCQQLYMPVRFTQTIYHFSQQGISNIVECGAGKVLTGLIKRIEPGITLYNFDKIDAIPEVMEKL